MGRGKHIPLKDRIEPEGLRYRIVVTHGGSTSLERKLGRPAIQKCLRELENEWGRWPIWISHTRDGVTLRESQLEPGSLWQYVRPRHSHPRKRCDRITSKRLSLGACRRDQKRR